MKNLMNRKELCHALNGKLTLWTIGELTRRGEIPYIKIPNLRVYLYDLDKVEKWFDKLQDQSTLDSRSGIKAVR